MLDTTTLFAYIDSIRNMVINAQIRHFKKWPLLGLSGPAPDFGPVAITYTAEIDSLKNWIRIRLNWLDENIPGICRTTGAGVDKINSLINFNCYPNPAQDYFTIDYTLQSPTNVCVRLYNYLGTEVLSLPQTTKNTGHHALKLETVTLSPGIYILKFDVGKSVISKKIVVLK
jgi:hypothetical protein